MSGNSASRTSEKKFPSRPGALHHPERYGSAAAFALRLISKKKVLITFAILGFPGEYPFTRGVQRNMYRGKLWTMRQFAGSRRPPKPINASNSCSSRARRVFPPRSTCQRSWVTTPTVPTAKGEVGKCGVAVSSLEDMEELFAGIPLGEVTTSMTINAPAIVILAMYLAVAEKQGVPKDKVRGTLQNDILKEYIAQKEWIFPVLPGVQSRHRHDRVLHEALS